MKDDTKLIHTRKERGPVKTVNPPVERGSTVLLPTREILPHEIVETVASFFKKTPAQLAQKTRRREILWPRQLAMYLCQRYTDAPTSAIGRMFGKEHTSVRTAVTTVEREMLEKAPRRYQVEALCRQIESQRASR